MAEFGTITETLDDLYVSTARNFRKGGITDQTFDRRVLLDWLMAKGRMDFRSGGRQIEERVSKKRNPNAGKGFGKGSSFSPAPHDHMTVTQWDWKYHSGDLIRLLR